MINFVVGKPGQGKTYILTCLAKQFLEQGRNVYSNFHIMEDRLNLKRTIDIKKSVLMKTKIYKPLGTLYYWTKLKQFKSIYKGVILVDEAQVYFNARKWREMSEEDELKFQQHRKDGLDIWGTVQNFKRANNIVRELVQEIYLMKKVGKLFWWRMYEPEEIDLKEKKSFETKFFWFNLNIAKSYNTNEIINKHSSDFNKIELPLMRDSFDNSSKFFSPRKNLEELSNSRKGVIL